MRKSLKATGAAALAAATVVSGLSFGSAAATAAPAAAAEPSSSKASTQALSFKAVFKTGSTYYVKRQVVDTAAFDSFSSYAAAAAAATSATIDGYGVETTIRIDGRCLNHMGQSDESFQHITLSVCASGASSQKWTVERSGKIISKDLGTSLSRVDWMNVTGAWRFILGSGAGGFASEGMPPEASNGGVAAGSNASTKLTRGATVAVPFGMRATAAYNKVNSSTITFTAPANTTFTSGQTVRGQWRTGSSTSWNIDPTLNLKNVSITNGGKTMTGAFASQSGFEQPAGHEVGWLPMVTANSDAPSGQSSMSTTAAGSTNLGSFTVSGTSATTIDTGESTDLTAHVDRVDDASRTAYLSGAGTPGALIKVNGVTIATVAAVGYWGGSVSGLNFGSNTITVEQWNGGVKTDQVTVVATIAGDVLDDGHGPDTELTRGASTEVFAHVRIADDFHSVKDGKVVFTAPAGTTFAADQDEIVGSYKPADDSWSATQRLKLSGGSLSSDRKTYTFDWTSDSGVTFPKDGEIRWGIQVSTPATGDAISSELGYTVSGGSNKGNFSAEGWTKTTAPAPDENGGFSADGIGHALTIEQGATEDVSFGMKADSATTLDGTTEITATAPAGTTFPSGLTKLTGSYKTASGNWSANSGLDVTGTVSADGRTFTGMIADASHTFAAGSEARWTGKLAAASDAAVGTRDLGFTVEGTTNLGSFSVAGGSAVTITKKEVAPIEDLVVTAPVNGSTVDTKRPVFTGAGDEGATIEIKGTTRVVATTTVKDGKWSVPSSIDLGDGIYNLTAVQTATSGAVQTKSISFTIKDSSGYVDLTAKGAFDTDVTKPATISGAATTGGIVIVKDVLGNEIGRATAVDGKYSIAIPTTAAQFGVNEFTVTQTVKGDVSAPVKVSLDYGTPAAINITSPANGSTVGKDGLTFTGTGENGARVEIRGSVRAIATGTVANGTWTAPVTIDLSSNVYNLRAVQTTKGGLTTNQAITVTIVDQTVAPLTATAAFNAQDENLPATISGNAQIDATVTVKNADGKVIGTAKATGGKYSIAIDAKDAKFGINTFTVTQTAFGKESDPLSRNLDYGNPVAPVISTPANGATVNSGKVTFTGTGSSGATIEMRGTVSAVGTSTVANGAWTVETRELTANVYRLFAVQTSKGGLTKQVETMVTLEDKKTTELTAAGTFGTEADADATIAGNAETGATVVIKEGNTVIKTVTAADSKYSVAIPATKSGIRTFTVTQTIDGVVSAAKTVSLDYGTVTDVQVTSPSNGDFISESTITFTGTGNPGAKVKVSGTTSQLGTATVNASGDWTITLNRELTPQDYTLFVKQTTKGNLVGDAVERTFTVIK